MTNPQTDEQVLKELRKINNQLNPLPALLRAFFWFAVVFFALGLFSYLCLSVSRTVPS